MKYYLAKSEPSVYSIDDLERDHKTVWDGVTNPQAVRAIRAMMPSLWPTPLQPPLAPSYEA